MRALFTTHPAASHLDPMLPLIRQLAARGVQVSVAAPEPFAEAVRRRGIDFQPVGLPWLEAAAVDTFAELATMPLDEQGYWWVTDIFADRAAKPAAEHLVDLIDRRPVDLIVRDYWEFGGWAAARATDTPCAVVGLAMHEPAADMAAFIGAQLDDLLAHVGVAATDDLSSLYAGPYVDLVPPSYQLTAAPDPVHLRPVDLPQPRGTAPTWLRDHPERPTVLVTLGTVFNQTPGVFEAVINALADEPVNVVVTTGRGVDPAGLPCPPNALVEQFLPHGAVLPWCDAVVCHAGFSTTMAALAHDLPVVAIPLSADQPIHAARCAQLGVGLQLPRDGLQADAVAEAVRRALDDGDLRRRAAGLGAEIRAMPGAGPAADALERAAGR